MSEFNSLTLVMGKKIVEIIEYSLNLFAIAYLSFRSVILDQSQNFRSIASVVSAQIYFTGWQALPLISILASAAGAILVLQSSSQLTLMGGFEAVGKLIIIIIIREMSPLLTALVVVARSGTAVASELGNMKVNREIEALESMGIDPLSYIVFPRLLGGIMSVLCLSFYFNFFALLSSFLIAKFVYSISLSFFWESITDAYSFVDTVLFLIKNFFSGFIIFIVSTYQGLNVDKGSFEVPQATTKAVMNTLVYVITFNFMVTLVYYLSQWGLHLW